MFVSFVFEIGLAKIIWLQNTQKEAQKLLGRISASVGSLESHHSEKAALSSKILIFFIFYLVAPKNFDRV